MNPQTIKYRKVIETPMLVAVLEVPATVTPELPDDVLFDAATSRLIAEARQRTIAGDRAWLREHGAQLYARATAG